MDIAISNSLIYLTLIVLIFVMSRAYKDKLDNIKDVFNIKYWFKTAKQKNPALVLNFETPDGKKCQKLARDLFNENTKLNLKISEMKEEIEEIKKASSISGFFDKQSFINIENQLSKINEKLES